jgi:formate/nitrite transporter FocA (FNT family)
VVLGRQQLFTENTLTVILPLLHERSASNAKNVARLWIVVLLGNLLGALIFAWVAADTEVFTPAVRHAFTEIGQLALRDDFGTTLWRAVFAGWLIALMVWLLPFAESGRIAVIVLLTFLIGLGGFAHVVAGAIEVMYLAISGAASWNHCVGGFLLPALLGNVLGGVALVALINHAQVVAGGGEDV